jgi:hypothetical protein
MNIYLAGPMRGIAEFNFPAFHKAARLLRAEGHEVFNPAERDEQTGFNSKEHPDGDMTTALAKGFSLRDALAADTHYICIHANAIALLPGWENSGGARAEHALAHTLRHTIIILGGEYT